MLLLWTSVAACGSARPAESEPQFGEPFAALGKVASAPVADHPSWPRRLQVDCAARSGPVLCVGPTDKQSYAKGEAVAAAIAWRGVPEGASIVVYLEHDDPSGRIRYLGPTGALVPSAIAAAGSGGLRFRWNGREFPCAPADAPMLCKETAEIGRYRLRALLYDRGNIVIAGWPSRDKPVILRHAVSPPFMVTGKPDLRPIARTLWWAALDQLMRDREIETSGTLAGDINGSAVRIDETPAGRLCAPIPARAPYQSTVKACVHKRKTLGDAGLLPIESADVAVTGHVTVGQGAMSREQAVAAARAVSDVPYLPRVAFRSQPQSEEAGYDYSRDGDFYEWSRRNPRATTYLSDSIGETIYRPDLGGAWVVVVNEIMAGGSLPDSKRFADKVLVLVEPGPRACVLETLPYKGTAFAADLSAAPLRCPAPGPAIRPRQERR